MDATTDFVIDVAGTPRARGLTQARLCGHAFDAAAESLAHAPLLPSILPHRLKAGVVRRGLGLLGRRVIRHHLPALRAFEGGRYLEIIEGIADGFGVAPGDVYGFNMLELEGSNLPFSIGCTALCSDAPPLLAYNHDFPPPLQPWLVLRRSEARGGLLASVAMTYPLLAGSVCGVNEAGLAIAVNHAFSTRIDRRRPAVFPTITAQACLDGCVDTASAALLVAETPATNGAIVSIVDAAGHREIVELTPAGATRRAVERGEIQWSFNKFRTDEQSANEVPVEAVAKGAFSGQLIHRSSLMRQGHLERIRGRLDRVASAEDARAILAYHGPDGRGCGDTICRHDDPVSETIGFAIVDPVARTLRAGRGKPCAPAVEATVSPPAGTRRQPYVASRPRAC